GDGTQTRDFVYIDDVVQANLLAAEAPEAVGKVVNIGRGERTSLQELLATLGTLLGTALTPEFAPAHPGDVHDSVADISMARSVLGFEPRTGFGEGLARTAAYFRSRGA